MDDKFIKICIHPDNRPLTNKMGEYIDIYDTPFTSELKIKLFAWWCDSTEFVNWSDDCEDIQESEIQKAISLHNERGLLLAREVKCEYPDWAVVFSLYGGEDVMIL